MARSTTLRAALFLWLTLSILALPARVTAHASSTAATASGRSGAGAATWISRRNPVSGDAAVTLNAVACSTARICVAVGGTGTILSTTDGGVTWHKRYSGTPVGLDAVTCVTKGVCLAVGEQLVHYLNVHYSTGDRGGAILTSQDGGLTWRQRHNPMDTYLNTCPSCLVAIGEALHGTSCWSLTGCLAVGEDAALLVSTDGGAGWIARRSLVIPGGQRPGLWAIACPFGRTCLAAGEHGTILTSTDGGANWTIRPNPYSGTWSVLNAIACASSKVCLAAGDSGMLASADGGATWHQSTGPRAAAITCPTSKTCLAVGDNGTIATSLDAGATWSTYHYPSAAGTAFQGVACVSGNTCLAVGQNGTILQNTDLGAG